MTRLTVIVTLMFAAPATAQPVITLDQVGGPGNLQYAITGAGAGAELYTLVNFTQYTPSGSGPIFGLGLAGSEILVSQILLPIGSDPHHVYADALGTYSWVIAGPAAGIVFDVDVVCIEWGPAGYVDHSAVVAATISL